MWRRQSTSESRCKVCCVLSLVSCACVSYSSAANGRRHSRHSRSDRIGWMVVSSSFRARTRRWRSGRCFWFQRRVGRLFVIFREKRNLAKQINEPGSDACRSHTPRVWTTLHRQRDSPHEHATRETTRDSTNFVGVYIHTDSHTHSVQFTSISIPPPHAINIKVMPFRNGGCGRQPRTGAAETRTCTRHRCTCSTI